MGKEQVFTTEWLGRTLSIKTGRLALQANAAVTVQYGDTVVLATVVEAKKERENIDFFPLMVDFEERLYAAGIIKGSRWVKREGRPTDEAILAGRMIDRSIRPLFDESSRKDVQVILTVLSADRENDHDIVSLVAASAALMLSGVAWGGPIGGVRVGRADNAFIFNPTYEQRELSDLDLIVAGTKEKVIMIEAGANEISEDEMFKAIWAGHAELQGPISLIEEVRTSLGIQNVPAAKQKPLTGEEKLKLEEGQKQEQIARKWLEENIEKILFDKIYYTKGERKAAVAAIKEGLDAHLFEKGIGREARGLIIGALVETAVEARVSEAILAAERRVDGRKLDELRPLSADAGILPRNHGSGLFSRGETQVMSIVTLGSPGMQQQLEGIEGMAKKRYMHHYTFPPYSVGEVKPIFSAGRREIGHGALAEKALMPLLPEQADFPYTIRVVSETLSSNGSSSMASTCGSSLALMDAGVPIKKAVAGIAMGLASDEKMERWKVLTDLQDLEDGKGGMDFKITGTADGITAIQLDTKTSGLSREIVKQTLEQGREARLEILKEMEKAIDKPRPDLSPYAPRIYTIHIDPLKIREVIGAGGKVINEIIDATGVTIDVEQDGTIMITGADSEKCEEAVLWISNIVREFLPGEMFYGKVVRMLDFGAFVELVNGRDGMVHVSELAPYRIDKPQDFLKLGDMVWVKIKEIDDQGRINLTMRNIPENEAFWKEENGKSKRDNFAPRGPRPFGDRDRQRGRQQKRW